MDISLMPTIEEKLAYEQGIAAGIEWVLGIALKHSNAVGDPYLHDTLERLLDDELLESKQVVK